MSTEFEDGGRAQRTSSQSHSTMFGDLGADTDTIHRRGDIMQRLGWSARCCGRRNLKYILRRLSNSSTGSEHDDFWTAAQTEAKTTPAYQQATQASAGTPSPSVDGDQWAVPGGFGPGRMPMGEAYGPSSASGDGNNSGAPLFTPRPPPSPPFDPSTNTFDSRDRYLPEPAFDMLASMHLSPFKQAVVRSFKGTTVVDIRQFFKGRDGNAIPTKKGICLTIPQWRRLQKAIGDIDHKIRETEENGGEFARGVEEGPDGRAT